MSDLLTESLQCEQIGCTNFLGYFDVKNNKRFCLSCRMMSHLRWKCKTNGCMNILDSNTSRETRKYCDECKGIKP